jgi:hypothetical protein
MTTMASPFPINVPACEEGIPRRSERLVVWVDGVGAFLLCLGETTTLGGLAGPAEVRLTADLSSRHASIHRSGEGYVIEAHGPVLVASETRASVVPTDADPPGTRSHGSGRIVQSRTNLNQGDELVLFREGGRGVRLRFTQPNPLTGTAILSIASDHRTEPRYEGIVLLAEACVFGPGPEAHVRCREGKETMLLFRRDAALFCKSPLPFTVSGKPGTGLTPVHVGDYVVGAGISFRLENPVKE